MSEYTAFISYSRQDAATANLLAYILHRKIRIHMDINMETGMQIASTIQKFIEECDIFIYIVSQNSLSSPWVQQEIGYALALKKPILPLSLSPDITDIKGMIEENILINHLPNWTDYKRNVDKIRNTILNLAKAFNEKQKYPVRELDLAFNNKLARTRVLVEQLEQILDSATTAKRIEIYHMAAFSIFSYSDDQVFLEYCENNSEYYNLLLKEKKLMEKLIKNDNVFFQLIIYPYKYYDWEYRAKRFENLLEWLKLHQNSERIDFVTGTPKKENWYIINGVENSFFLHGIKYQQKPGFQINTLTYNKGQIQNQIYQFKNFFNNLKKNAENESKETTIEKIESVYEKLKNEVL